MPNDEHFMKIALVQAEKALSEGEFPVGCALVLNNEVIVTSSRTGTRKEAVNEIDHAEMLALKLLSGLQENIVRDKITLFCTLEPCLMCLGAILLSGIYKIVYAYEDVMGGGMQYTLTNLAPLYRDKPISIIPNILRNESLALFKAYFSNPASLYWKGSLLAEYTLSQ